MSSKSIEERVLYLPDSPNIGDVQPERLVTDQKAAALERAQADELAAKVSIGDELSEYEKVAGRGVP